MAISVANAINAYADVARSGGAGMQPRGQQAGESFAQLVNNVAADALQAGTHADKMSAAAVDGKANVAEIVTAVANAELALQTVVAVRDQVVQAYQEILRMPI